jgi:hypothetical protein
MKTIKLIIAIISLVTLALLTGCSGGSKTPGNTKVGLKVVFANASSANSTAYNTIQSLGIHSLILEIIPANPSINLNQAPYQSSYDLMTATGLQQSINLPDPVSPALLEPYLFRIMAWDASNKLVYCGQKRVDITAGNNIIDLMTFAFNGFDAVVGAYTVSASDGTTMPLTIDLNGKGTGTSSGGSLVTAYLAPTPAGVFDVTIVAKNQSTNTLGAYGSGTLDVNAGSGSGSVKDSTGLTPTWTITKFKTDYATAVGTYDGTPQDSGGSQLNTFTLTIDSNGTVTGTTQNGYVISGKLISNDNIIFTYSGTSTSGSNVVNWQGSTSGTSGIISGSYSGAISGNGTWSATKRSSSPGITIKSVLQSGMYGVKDRSYSSGTTSSKAYATTLLGLAADGVNLTETYTYYDPSTRIWSTTLPTGIPANLFAGSADYYLTASGWVSGTAGNGPQDISIAFNSDGTATISNKIDGSSAHWAVTSTDISGQSLSAMASGISSWPILTTAGNFPSGSIRYVWTWTNLNDSYDVWSDGSVSGVTTLDQIPGTVQSVYLDADDPIYSYYARFVSGGTTVDIYQTAVTVQGNYTGTPVKIGSGTYALITVSGQRILEITIPTSLRTQYRLESNPIFGVVPSGLIYRGTHSVPGVEYTNGPGTTLNGIAIQYLQNSLNSGGGTTPIPTGNVTATW